MDVAVLEKLRRKAEIPVKLLCVKLLGTSRTAYYNWLNGAVVRRVKNKKRINGIGRCIALSLRDGTLPVSDELKLKERDNRILLVIKEQLTKQTAQQK